jgi:hypothetical protein
MDLVCSQLSDIAIPSGLTAVEPGNFSPAVFLTFLTLAL